MHSLVSWVISALLSISQPKRRRGFESLQAMKIVSLSRSSNQSNFTAISHPNSPLDHHARNFAFIVMFTNVKLIVNKLFNAAYFFHFSQSWRLAEPGDWSFSAFLPRAHLLCGGSHYRLRRKTKENVLKMFAFDYFVVWPIKIETYSSVHFHFSSLSNLRTAHAPILNKSRAKPYQSCLFFAPWFSLASSIESY